jgi:hypothetical protein
MDGCWREGVGDAVREAPFAARFAEDGGSGCARIGFICATLGTAPRGGGGRAGAAEAGATVDPEVGRGMEDGMGGRAGGTVPALGSSEPVEAARWWTPEGVGVWSDGEGVVEVGAFGSTADE